MNAAAYIRSGKMVYLFGRWWAITALILALSMLGAAWGFQIFGHLAPCHLCLKQRDIYWMAVGVSLVSCIWALFTGSRGAPRVFNFVLFAIFITGAALALFHAGVEMKWWLGPQTCTGGGSEISFDSMAAFAAGAAVAPPQCDIAAWRMFGISMAGYNVLISAALALLSLIASMRFRTKRHHRATHPPV